MLGLLLLYWIGKYFYQLAEKFEKQKWGYAIFGIAVYYGSQLIIGVVLGLFDEFLQLGIDFDGILINLMGIPIGLICCYFLFKYFEKKWKSEYVDPISEIETIGETEE